MMPPARLPDLLRTIPRLGLGNVARVAVYRARLAAGWRPAPIADPWPGGPVFGEVAAGAATTPVEINAFGWQSTTLDGPPDWHRAITPPHSRLDPAQDWRASLTLLRGRDAKTFWELSRFYWVPQFALAARAGDTSAAARLDAWIADWIGQNPPNQGINWACGQEAAIRTMNLALAALVLGSWAHPSPSLQWLLQAHAARIAPTISYAMGQDNNHGSSEACALYILGSWGKRWQLTGAARLERRGLRLLANRALRLIQPDGSPAQYSVTYHRANLETFALAELWARKTGAPALPDPAHRRIAAGARWLHAMVDAGSGDAPNLGANDGSELFNLTGEPDRDFRPTVDLAARLFDHARAWSGYENPRLAALGLDPAEPRAWPVPVSATFDDGGYHLLRRGPAFALLRYPRFRFRPSQADALHLDLWVGGNNLLRDAGSFSYAAEDGAAFSGPGAHNTAQFDGRDQMPRLGRFLFGDWLKSSGVQPVAETAEGGVAAAAGYRDRWGAHHHRRVALRADGLVCTDRLGGTARTAVLRWRLAPGDWTLEGATLTGPGLCMTVRAEGPLALRLVTGEESRHYLERTPLPVFEIETGVPAEITTDIAF